MKKIIFLGLLALAPPIVGAPVELKSLRYWNAPDHCRVVLDLSAPVEHKLFTLSNPDRVVVAGFRGQAA